MADLVEKAYASQPKPKKVVFVEKTMEKVGFNIPKETRLSILTSKDG